LAGGMSGLVYVNEPDVCCIAWASEVPPLDNFPVCRL
jgi:hypothetical protein